MLLPAVDFCVLQQARSHRRRFRASHGRKPTRRGRCASSSDFRPAVELMSLHA
jgi:hypothetical protein